MTDVEIQWYKTSDMALVATLRMEGFEPQQVTLDDGTCHWHFILTQSLLKTTEEFRDGTCRVEPKEYNRLFGVTKKDMFRLTDPLDLPHAG